MSKPSTNTQIRTLARELYINSEARKEAARKEAEASKKLLALLDDEGIVEHETTIVSAGGTPISLNVRVDQPVTNYVDTELLFKKVDLPMFRKIVTATQQAVTKFAGTAVNAACLKQRKGDKKVYLTEVK